MATYLVHDALRLPAASLLANSGLCVNIEIEICLLLGVNVATAFFKRAEDSVTQGHSWKLVKESCRHDCRLHFFSQRVINRWNSLSQADIDAATVNSFKNRLEMRRKCQMRWAS